MVAFDNIPTGLPENWPAQRNLSTNALKLAIVYVANAYTTITDTTDADMTQRLTINWVTNDATVEYKASGDTNWVVSPAAQMIDDRIELFMPDN